MERPKADLRVPILDSTDHTFHQPFAGILPISLVEMHCHEVDAFIVAHLILGETRSSKFIPKHTWLHHIEGFRNLLAVGLVIKLLNKMADYEQVQGLILVYIEEWRQP